MMSMFPVHQFAMRSVRLVAAMCVLAVCNAASLADTLHVPIDYATIQAAIDAAVDGDEVVVAPGTYHEAINFLGKAITVRSSGGREVTTIDASTLPQPVSVVTFANGETRDAVLDGFTIRGGTGTPEVSPVHSHAGGGVFVLESSPTIRNCIITQNMANYGAGISATDGSDPLIENCHIIQNQGDGQVSWGAGVAIGDSSTGHLFDTIIESNIAFAGGGLLIHGNVSLGGTIIENCQFLMNSGDNGGGANVNGNGLAIFKNCSFVNNPGYGVFVIGVITSNPVGTAEFENCYFTGPASGTVAIYTGGPVSVLGTTFVNIGRAIQGSSTFGPKPYSVTVEDSHFENITNGAVGNTHAGGSLTITNCSFVNNTAGPASNSAGAVNAVGTTIITGSTFIGNKTSANSGGGAIYQGPFSGSNLLVSDSFFVDNSSMMASGGAIKSFFDAAIANSVFDNNSAPSGGAVSVGGGSSVVSSISGCTFEGNNASDGRSGGGALLKGGSSSLTVADATFLNNETGGHGGAIRHEAGALSVSHSSLRGNTATSGGAASRSATAGEMQFQSTLFCENAPDHVDGVWTDLGGNEFLDECPLPIPGDLDGDGSVGVPDLLLLLGAWGSCDDCTPGAGSCFGDLDGDCTVGVADLLLLLANWG